MPNLPKRGTRVELTMLRCMKDICSLLDIFSTFVRKPMNRISNKLTFGGKAKEKYQPYLNKYISMSDLCDRILALATSQREDLCCFERVDSPLINYLKTWNPPQLCLQRKPDHLFKKHQLCGRLWTCTDESDSLSPTKSCSLAGKRGTKRKYWRSSKLDVFIGIIEIYENLRGLRSVEWVSQQTNMPIPLDTTYWIIRLNLFP